MTNIEKHERCKDCEYRKKINAQDDFWLNACYCKPYKGKWIVEIDNCPKAKKGE